MTGRCKFQGRARPVSELVIRGVGGLNTRPSGPPSSGFRSLPSYASLWHWSLWKRSSVFHPTMTHFSPLPSEKWRSKQINKQIKMKQNKTANPQTLSSLALLTPFDLIFLHKSSRQVDRQTASPLNKCLMLSRWWVFIPLFPHSSLSISLVLENQYACPALVPRAILFSLFFFFPFLWYSIYVWQWQSEATTHYIWQIIFF